MELCCFYTLFGRRESLGLFQSWKCLKVCKLSFRTQKRQLSPFNGAYCNWLTQWSWVSLFLRNKNRSASNSFLFKKKTFLGFHFLGNQMEHFFFPWLFFFFYILKKFMFCGNIFSGFLFASSIVSGFVHLYLTHFSCLFICQICAGL